MNGFDCSELEKLNSQLIKLANEDMTKESKKFMQQEGSKLVRKVKRRLKVAYGKKTGNLVKMVKRGKAYLYEPENAHQIRVHFAPHMNVVDYGHRDAHSGKMVLGKKVKEEQEALFFTEFAQDVDKFVDDMLDGGLK